MGLKQEIRIAQMFPCPGYHRIINRLESLTDRVLFPQQSFIATDGRKRALKELFIQSVLL